MNLVDVDPRSSERAVFWRNVLNAIVVIGGSLGMIAAAFWFLFGVLIPGAH